MTVRSATPADYEVVESIWQAQNEYHHALEPTRIRRAEVMMSRDAFIEVLENEHKDILLIPVDDTIAGAALLEARFIKQSNNAFAKDVAFVQEICVLPAHRGKSLGQTLMGAIEEWGRERRLGSVELNVWSRNEAAIGFYEALGFASLRIEYSKPL